MSTFTMLPGEPTELHSFPRLFACSNGTGNLQPRPFARARAVMLDCQNCMATAEQVLHQHTRTITNRHAPWDVV